MYLSADDFNQSVAARVWQHFYSISQIPRGSGNEQQICRFLIDFAEQHKLKWRQDSFGNMVIYKAATEGEEQRPVTILQSHVDMVEEKTDDSSHDFSCDPIQWLSDGEWLKADNTTLGADNGIGVAAMLAVLENNEISHGAIEALFTLEEETTMAGAMAVEGQFFKGKTLINLDSEDSRVLTVGCAGGVNLDISQTYQFEQVSGDYCSCAIKLSGLKGGHSGCDIHLQRGNAILLMARVLARLQSYGLRIVRFNGGTVDNAIPRSAEVEIALPTQNKAEFLSAFDSLISEIKTELRSVDAGLHFTLEPKAVVGAAINSSDQDKLLKTLHGCLNGVHRFSDDFKGVVETSSNLGVLKLENGQLYAECFVRSLVDSATQDSGEKIAGQFELAGAQVERRGFFPGWKPEPASKLLDLLAEEYKVVNGESAQVEVVHAALECGIIGAELGGADMVSIGPDIENPHSPDERIHIASVDRFYQLLLKGLASI